MTQQRQWTVNVTRLEPAHTPKYWIVGYTLYDQDFPHRIESMLVPANDSIDAFFAFERAVEKWKSLNWDVQIVWFKQQEEV